MCTFMGNQHFTGSNAMGLHEIIWEVSVDREEVLGLNRECYMLERQGGTNKKV